MKKITYEYSVDEKFYDCVKNVYETLEEMLLVIRKQAVYFHFEMNMHRFSLDVFPLKCKGEDLYDFELGYSNDDNYPFCLRDGYDTDDCIEFSDFLNSIDREKAIQNFKALIKKDLKKFKSKEVEEVNLNNQGETK